MHVCYNFFRVTTPFLVLHEVETMSKRTHKEALQTKQAILKAAERVFVSKGFVKTSLSDIALEANVTRGAIYWHFENKNELLAALIEDELIKLNNEAGLSTDTEHHYNDPLGKLKQWALQHFTEESASFLSSSLCSIFHSILFSDVDQEARDKLNDIVQGRNILVQDLLRQAVACKQLPYDMDIEVAASYISAILGGLLSHIYQNICSEPIAYYRKIIEVTFKHLGNIKKNSSIVWPEDKNRSYLTI